MTDEPPFKPAVWVGSSRKDLRDFPDIVQDHMGYALYIASKAANTVTRNLWLASVGPALWKS